MGALGVLRDTRAIDPLIAEHPAVREGAARALGQLGGARAAPRLRLALKDKKPVVRRAAADALARLERRTR